MLLQRSSELQRRILGMRPLARIFLCIVVLGGCAAAPKPAVTSTSQDEQSEQVAADERLLEIPPRVLTEYERAVAIMAAGDYADAERLLEKFVSAYPEYPGAHVNLAILGMVVGDDEAAEGHINAALAIDPGHPVALNQLGILLRRQGKFFEAEAAYLKAVTATPDYALAHYNLGVLNELYLRRLDVALQHFETYQEIEGEDKQVTKWIVDLRRRLSAQQSAANAAE
jgi:tetratricopeptide (TPR) repeat protein